jgi:hypothetical protein
MFLKHKLSVLFMLICLGAFSQPRFTVSGLVSDSITGNALSKVDVVVNKLDIGTISNSNGFYSLRLQKGSYEFKFMLSNYETQTILVEVNGNTELPIVLKAQNLQNEVSDRAKQRLAETVHSKLKLDNELDVGTKHR